MFGIFFKRKNKKNIIIDDEEIRLIIKSKLPRTIRIGYKTGNVSKAQLLDFIENNIYMFIIDEHIGIPNIRDRYLNVAKEGDLYEM